MKNLLSFYYKNKKGFTLLETLIMISIISFLMINLINVFLFVNRYFNNYNLTNKNLNKANRVLEYISRDIKRSDSIELLENQMGYIKFNKKFPDNIGIILKIEEDNVNLYITYCLDGNKLRRLSYRTILDKIKTLDALGGYNILAEDIWGLYNTHYSEEDGYVDLKISLYEMDILKNYSQMINLTGQR